MRWSEYEYSGLAAGVPSFAIDHSHLRSMEIHGSILENIENAVASAHRLRGKSVYSDTLTYWRDLIQEAKRMLQNASYAKPTELENALAKLEAELTAREV